MTHALAGLLVAEAVVRTRERRGALERGFTPAAYWVSALANNLPDLDFLVVGLTGGKLGYLLHHRGHTHTVAFVPVAAALLLGGTFAWHHRGDHRWSARTWAWIAGLAFAGPVLHLTLDATNNYGVHPFWPLDDRWFYGDGVFIVEPYLLLSGIAGLVYSARSWQPHAALAVLAMITLGMVWGTGFVGMVPACAVTGFGAGLVLLMRPLAPLARVAAATSAWVAATAAFFGAGSVAEAALTEDPGFARPPASSIDTVLTPLPANPWCWTVLSVERDGRDYVVRRATITPWPEFLNGAACPPFAFGSPTAPVTPASPGSSGVVTWHDEYRAPLAELRALSRESCQASAFLRFARVPYWNDAVIGDLRYDREPELGFAELARETRPCPDFVPGWRWPRSDVLSP